MIQKFHEKISLYKRKLVSGVVYYARFWTGSEWTSGVNTGQSNKAAALAWSRDALEKQKPETPTLASYTQNFFAPGGEYTQARAFDSAKPVPPQTLRDHETRLKLHLLPALGSRTLGEISTSDITALQTKLSANLKTQTVVHIVNTLSVILRCAAEAGVIQTIPVIRKLAIAHDARGAYTVEEARRILSAAWPDPAHRLINLLAAYTGMRQGEILGLAWSSIHPDYIEVYQVWNETQKKLLGTRDLPATKARKIRFVPLPDIARRELEAFKSIALFSDPSDLIFSLERGRPVKNWSIVRTLSDVLSSVGIPEEARLERNLDFHSWRHFYNSVLISGRIPLVKVQSVVGHTSDRMSSTYYHAEDYIDIQNLIDSALCPQE
jgi:integrase